MQTTDMSNTCRALCSLLKRSLWQPGCTDELDFELSTGEWEQLISHAARQGVLALAFDGLPLNRKIPGLTKEQLIRWHLSVQRIEAVNKRQRLVLQQLITIFRANRIRLLLLKGLGLSQYFPRPEHRECGDLDIYLFGEYEKANSLMEEMDIPVNREGSKHAVFRFWGVPVENHRHFLNAAMTKTDRNLEDHLEQILSEKGRDQMYIANVPVCVPNPDFAALFLTRHAITHFLSSGMVLRNFCDLALFFHQNAARIDFSRLHKILIEEGQFALYASFMNIARDYIGMPPVAGLPVVHDDQVTRKVWHDTLCLSLHEKVQKERTGMWHFKRKALGSIHLFQSKWKYDLLTPHAFQERLALSLRSLCNR